MNIFQTLAQGDHPIAAILATIILAQTGAIAYLFNYLVNKTAPKWIVDNLSSNMEKTLDGVSKIVTVLEERKK